MMDEMDEAQKEDIESSEVEEDANQIIGDTNEADTIGGKRTRKPTGRYDPVAFNARGERRRPPQEGDTICFCCEHVVEAEEGVLCASCDSTAHILYVGLESRPKSAFECEACETARLNDAYLDDEASVDESEEDEGNDDDDEWQEDGEGSEGESSGLSEQGDEENPLPYLPLRDFEQVADEVAYSDEEATLRYYLTLSADKIYEDKDLDDEETLLRALRLLYAARTGEGRLRLKPKIHIIYTQLHTEMGQKATGEMAVAGAELKEFLSKTRSA